MPDGASGFSPSVEDYLKAIYTLSGDGGAVSTSAIAASLDIQPASVTEMIKRLAESGLLHHAPYRGAQLTRGGTRAALRIIRRHRILETYLTERLGFPWEEVHEEAERLEHAASEALVERMAEALGNPIHDPHGAPIPTPGGEVEATDSRNLLELDRGTEARIRAIRDDDSAELQAAEAAGLLPGQRVRVLERADGEGMIRLEVGDPPGTRVEVERELARRVFVTAVTHG